MSTITIDSTLVALTEEQYKIGIQFLIHLMSLKDIEIKEVIKKLISRKVPEHVLAHCSGVYRRIFNEIPSEIEIAFFDSVTICPFNISYKPEHGDRIVLIEFNEYFKYQ